MAETPKHITITVDEDALTEQIRGIIAHGLQEAGWALRRAADQLQPDFMDQERKWWREQWDREHAEQEAPNCLNRGE